MRWRYVSFIVVAVIALCGLGLFYLAQHHTFLVLEPAGAIAQGERTLMLQATLLMLLVIIPVFFLAFFFAWRYRASNTKALYRPDWEHSKMDELVWWAIPFEIVLVLAALIWSSTHALDPKRAIESPEPPLVVQVVALDWKWLFIYPSLGVASVNELVLPVGQPVTFLVTSDAPMNSFWVPELGGQIYAMTGMSNTLNLIADKEGRFDGMSANYSGKGFADMRFVVKAVETQAYAAWLADMRTRPHTLTYTQYDLLSRPGTTTPLWFSNVEPGLYNDIVSSHH